MSKGSIGRRSDAIRALAAPPLGYGVAPLAFPDAGDAMRALLSSALTAAAPLPEDVRGELRADAGEGTLALLTAAQDADLLILGCRSSLRSSHAVRGAVTRHLIRRAKCPVVVVHRDGTSHVRP